MLLPGTVIEFDGIQAEVLEDEGGETLKVREDQGLEVQLAFADLRNAAAVPVGRPYCDWLGLPLTARHRPGPSR
jgi:hypothetical protein